MKKIYIKPATMAYTVMPAQIICGTGNPSSILNVGSDGNQPTPTSQGGNTGIFGESKSSDLEDF